MSAAPASRWVVTGAAGFFGLHLVERLVREGADVVALDTAPLDEVRARGVTCVRADVRDRASVARAMDGAEVLVHAAAALPRAHPREVRSVAVEGARAVYGAAARAGVRRCVHVGTTAVYGVPRGHGAGAITEDAPIAPLGVYGAAKWEAEQVCRAARANDGLAVTVLRPKSFVGVGRLGVFQILFDWVQAGKRIPVLGDGANRYQLLEVTDLVDAVVRAARDESPAAARGADYNVGAERFGTVAEDLAALCRHAGTGARVWPVPAAPARAALRALERARLSPLYGWVYETADKDSAVDTARITRALGWRPRFSNAEMLCRAYDWYVREGAALAAVRRDGTGHRTAWRQGMLRVLRWLS